MALDVEKMSRRRFDSHDENFTTGNGQRIMLTQNELADFARQVARAAARVAFPGGKPQEDALYDHGRKDAATAIRRAVAKGRKKG